MNKKILILKRRNIITFNNSLKTKNMKVVERINPKTKNNEIMTKIRVEL